MIYKTGFIGSISISIISIYSCYIYNTYGACLTVICMISIIFVNIAIIYLYFNPIYMTYYCASTKLTTWMTVRPLPASHTLLTAFKPDLKCQWNRTPSNKPTRNALSPDMGFYAQHAIRRGDLSISQLAVRFWRWCHLGGLLLKLRVRALTMRCFSWPRHPDRPLSEASVKTHVCQGLGNCF